MRSKAKMVSYGLAYGMESYGLAQRLGIPVEEAAGHPQGLLRGVPQRAGLHGPGGRRGARPGLHRDPCSAGAGSSRAAIRRYQVRAAGERQAMNAGIQGLAADIFKVALVRLDARLAEDGPTQSAGPAGPRRGHPRGSSRRGGSGDKSDPGSDARGGAPLGATGSKRLMGRQLGGREGLSAGGTGWAES